MTDNRGRKKIALLQACDVLLCLTHYRKYVDNKYALTT